MARPTKPKDLKPDEAAPVAGSADATVSKGGGGGLDLKFIVTIFVIVVCSIGSAVGAVYFLVPMVVVPAIVAQLPKAEAAEGEEGEGHEGGDAHKSVGLTLELDEFTVNLQKDPNIAGNQYVRTKMALSISVPPEEDCAALAAPAHAALPPAAAVASVPAVSVDFVSRDGLIAGAAAPVGSTYLASGGGGASPYDACMTHFKQQMGQFVPTMRDIINAALMKRTAGDLSSIEGQEALKDEIKEAINHSLTGHYKVLRVNLQDFIIQY